MAMKTGKLSEIIRIFEDYSYRESLIKEMPDSLHKLTLESFGKESDKRRAQILSLIYNRLDMILGDEYLFDAWNRIMVLIWWKLWSKKKQ